MRRLLRCCPIALVVKLTSGLCCITTEDGINGQTGKSLNKIKNMKADKFLTDNKKDGLSHFFITTKDIDTRGLDENTYYPVIMNLPIAPYSEICMWNALEGRAFPSWGTHPSGGYNVSIRWTSNGDGYGSSIVSRRILEAVQCFCTGNGAGDIGQATQSSAEYIRVRGGGYYHFRIMSVQPIEIELYPNGYEAFHQFIGTSTSVGFPAPSF